MLQVTLGSRCQNLGIRKVTRFHVVTKGNLSSIKKASDMSATKVGLMEQLYFTRKKPEKKTNNEMEKR